MARGRKTGGRTKGTPNKRTVAKRDELSTLMQDGTSPLQHLLSVMRDETRDDAARADAAKAAAPYCHPKLASIEHQVDQQQPVILFLPADEKI